MRAVQLTVFGEPRDARVSDVPMQEVRPGEALVKVLAAGINPSDLVNIRGGFKQTKLPRIIGRDFSGTVVEGPPELKGRNVWGSGGDIGFTRDGSHAEYLAVPQSALSLQPSKLSAESAAACGIPFITAYAALVERAHVKAGDFVAVSGAAGSVGTAAIEIAHARGAHTIALVKDESEASRVNSGKVLAIAQFDRNDLEGVVAKHTNGHGIDTAFNTVGASVFGALYQSLAIGGTMVIISRIGGAEVKLDLFDFYRRDLSLQGLDTAKYDGQRCARILDELRPGFEKGTIRPILVTKAFRLDDATEAYETVALGTPGKFVLAP